jgi:hypothetical protein
MFFACALFHALGFMGISLSLSDSFLFSDLTSAACNQLYKTPGIPLVFGPRLWPRYFFDSAISEMLRGSNLFLDDLV